MGETGKVFPNKGEGWRGLQNFFFVRDRNIWSPSLSDDTRKKKLGKQTIFLISECLSIWTIFMCPMHIGQSVCYIKDIVPCSVRKCNGKNLLLSICLVLSNWKSVVYSYSLDIFYVSLYYSTKYLRYCQMVQNFWIIV